MTRKSRILTENLAITLQISLKCTGLGNGSLVRQTKYYVRRSKLCLNQLHVFLFDQAGRCGANIQIFEL